MQDLKIALIQSSLFWEDSTANRAMFEEQIWSLEQNVDLVVLPEMFTTGFSMEPEKLSEPVNFNSYKWMVQQAQQHKISLTGSCIIKEGEHFYNRLIWVNPLGEISHYDKRHLFRMASEDAHYTEGTDRLVVELNGWRICPMICYDLRFPVWSRNTTVAGALAYDVLIYIANWPAKRTQAWDTLLKARAIENSCYSIGVNRVGQDGNGIDYSGHSGAYDYKGDTLAFSTDPTVLYVTLEKNSLMDYREKFPSHLDADLFEIK